jgi:hypothetical protein
LVILAIVGFAVTAKFDTVNANIATVKSDVNGHTDAAVAALKQDTTEKFEQFETKASHDADIMAVKDGQKKTFDRLGALAQTVADNHYETSLDIQQLKDAVNNQHSTTTTTTTSHQ